MKNKEMLEDTEAKLIAKANDETLEMSERKRWLDQALNIHEHLNKDEQVELTKKELELKLKSDKFNKVIGVTKDIVVPVVRGVSIAAFIIGITKVNQQFEVDHYYGTSAGKVISNIPTRLISNIINKM